MLHVLLVEDDDSTRQAVRDGLERSGHTVTEARDGAEGLSLALSAIFDVVVCDVHMPKMSGFTLFRRLQQERPQWPVIIMTTFGDVDDALYTVGQGAVDYVTKPFDPEAFAQRILGPIDQRLELNRQGR
jgi:DNA-binding response OmpR family regulator